MEKGAVYWLQLVGLTVTILGGIVAIYVALAVRTIHVLVNDRLTQLLKVSAVAERALGDAEGVERERVRKNDA